MFLSNQSTLCSMVYDPIMHTKLHARWKHTNVHFHVLCANVSTNNNNDITETLWRPTEASVGVGCCFGCTMICKKEYSFSSLNFCLFFAGFVLFAPHKWRHWIHNYYIVLLLLGVYITHNNAIAWNGYVCEGAKL